MKSGSDGERERRLLGMALLAMAVEREADPLKKGAYQFALDGARDKYGATRDDIRRYRETHADELEQAFAERMTPPHARGPKTGAARP